MSAKKLLDQNKLLWDLGLQIDKPPQPQEIPPNPIPLSQPPPQITQNPDQNTSKIDQNE